MLTSICALPTHTRKSIVSVVTSVVQTRKEITLGRSVDLLFKEDLHAIGQKTLVLDLIKPGKQN